MATPQPSSPEPTPGAQPKIVQTLLKRTAGVLVAFAAIFGGLRYIQSRQGDFDNGGDSKGMIAAIRLERDGQQVVLIHPDGTIVGTKSWKSGVMDREPAWAPNGRFLFYCSDRKENTFNVFRWNPQSDDSQKRTEPGGSRSNPTFAPGQTDNNPLIVAGGFVRELDAVTGRAQQILPPVNAEISRSGAGDEQGTEGSLSIYGGLGKSFRIARYLPGKNAIAAVMRRDEGEILVLQNLQPVGGKLPKPTPVMAGDHVDFDIDPTSGTVAFSVQGFRWVDKDAVPPQFHQGNRITTPFRNGVGLLDPAKGQPVFLVSTPTDEVGFGPPRISPDGTRLLLVAGRIEEGSLRPQALLQMPAAQGGFAQKSLLVQGEVYEPSWSADGKRIAYAKRAGGKRDVYTMNADGTGETNLTKGQGDFSMPLISPMGG